jgi:ubiquinone biosynthesis protein
MKEIVQVLSRYGFGHLIVRMNLLGHIPLVSRIGRILELPEGLTPMQDLAYRARMVLEELGPTFVKFGQLLSTRPDFVGQDFVEQFERLQDQVSAFDHEEAKKTIERSVGKPTSEVFSRFDDEPLASGSIGQAHTACLLDGTEVVVKVKRPGIDAKIRDDLNLLQVLAELSEHYLPELGVLRPQMVVEEFSRQLDKELDFITEAAYTSQFADLSQRVPDLKVPRVFWEYTSRDVLCIEKFEGVKIGDVEGLTAQGRDPKHVAAVLADAFLVQFFETGLFHADPHPGNILLLEDGKIGLIDFGMVGHLTEELKGHLGTLIIALFRRDVDLVVEVYRELGVFSEPVTPRDLKPDILEIIDVYFGVPLGKIDSSAIFEDILKLGRKHHGILPRDFVLLGKSMAVVGTLAKKLDPEFNLLESARPHTTKLLSEKLSPRRISNVLLGTSWSFLNLIKRLPSDISTLLRMLKGGKIQGILRHEGLESLVEEMERSSNRLSLGVILASLVVMALALTILRSGRI